MVRNSMIALFLMHSPVVLALDYIQMEVFVGHKTTTVRLDSNKNLNITTTEGFSKTIVVNQQDFIFLKDKMTSILGRASSVDDCPYERLEVATNSKKSLKSSSCLRSEVEWVRLAKAILNTAARMVQERDS